MRDAQTERALGSLHQRHEEKIGELAERIQEHVGYVLHRVSSGHAATAGLYAQDIAASAQEIVTHVAALEAIGETLGIFDAQDADQ